MPEGYTAPRGPAIIDLLWAELDESYAELVSIDYEEGIDIDAHEQEKRYAKAQGRCAGLAVAIAIMRNPYDPDDDVIREEVAERFASRVG